MRFLIIFFILFLFLFTDIGFSHKINTFAYREGNRIIGEAYFADGSPCIKCRVELYNKEGNKIFQTITDEKGRYNFVLKEKGSLKIKVIAGEGHLAEFELEGIKEPESESKLSKTSKEKKVSKAQKKSYTNKLSQSFEVVSNIDKKEIKKLVKEAVKEETEGIKNLLIEIKKDMDKVRLHDIIGGIGYIFGIWGIIILLKYKKRY